MENKLEKLQIKYDEETTELEEIKKQCEVFLDKNKNLLISIKKYEKESTLLNENIQLLRDKQYELVNKYRLIINKIK